MPQKIRELKARLLQAGFDWQKGKGSHTVWYHPKLAKPLVWAGNDSNDAKPYQEKTIREAINQTQR
jgi:predicted RNA binding protein YcfA (HicA-like mRNA interferase family)